MYTEAIPNLMVRAAGTPLSLASAAVIDRHLVFDGVWLQRVYFCITTAVVSGSPVLVAAKVRSAYGVTSGQVTLATITIPGGATVGSLYYKDIDPKKILPGQELVFEVTAAATSGLGIPGAKMGHQSEHLYATNMIASV